MIKPESANNLWKCGWEGFCRRSWYYKTTFQQQAAEASRLLPYKVLESLVVVMTVVSLWKGPLYVLLAYVFEGCVRVAICGEAGKFDAADRRTLDKRIWCTTLQHKIRLIIKGCPQPRIRKTRER